MNKNDNVKSADIIRFWYGAWPFKLETAQKMRPHGLYLAMHRVMKFAKNLRHAFKTP